MFPGQYNFPFTDNWPEIFTEIVQVIRNNQWDFLATILGSLSLPYVELGLKVTQSSDICGWSKNVLLYVKPTTLRYHANGYNMITSRANAQRVVYQTYTIFKELLAKEQRVL